MPGRARSSRSEHRRASTAGKRNPAPKRTQTTKRTPAAKHSATAKHSPASVKRSSTGVLDLALLGLLSDSPMHGYQLRARLTEVLGTVRSYSYGSLYPALQRLQRSGFIAVEQPFIDPDAVPLTPKRRRVTYHITAEGKEHLAQRIADAGPQSWTDDGFGVHLALFPHTAVETRLRILEGRRRRLEERREGIRDAMARAARRMDDYTLQLQQLAMEASDREVKWLTDVIDREGRASERPADPPHVPHNQEEGTI